jgi:hypothetical protein
MMSKFLLRNKLKKEDSWVICLHRIYIVNFSHLWTVLSSSFHHSNYIFNTPFVASLIQNLNVVTLLLCAAWFSMMWFLTENVKDNRSRTKWSKQWRRFWVKFEKAIITSNLLQIIVLIIKAIMKNWTKLAGWDLRLSQWCGHSIL